MLNNTDWIIIAIALASATIALLFLRPQTRNRDIIRLRDLRNQAEQEQKQSSQWLTTLKLAAQQAGSLNEQAQQHAQSIEMHQAQCQAHYETSKELLEQSLETESELRQISTHLGERLKHIQTYWDEQLDDTVNTVQQIRDRLQTSLEQVETSLKRLQDQENLAQTLTEQLNEQYQEQNRTHDLTVRLSQELRSHLDLLVKESGHSLEYLRLSQQQNSQLTQHFETELADMEKQASEHFTQLYQSSDQARQELKASVTEARHHLATLRRYEEQSTLASQVIDQNSTKLEQLNLEQLIKIVHSTQKLCRDLEQRLTKTSEVLGHLTPSNHYENANKEYALAINH